MYLYSGVKKSMHQNVTPTHNYKEKSSFFSSITIIEKKKSMYRVESLLTGKYSNLQSQWFKPVFCK